MQVKADKRTLVIEILYKSFLENGSVNYVVKQDSKRELRIRKLMSYSYFQGENSGKIYLSNDQNACAIVLIPSKKKKTSLKSILWDLKLVIGCIGLFNVSKVLKREAEIKKHHPKFPFLHLWYIGVEPSVQGKGHGNALMEVIMQEAERERLPIYLETSNPRNFAFYEKLGFKVLSEINQNNSTLKMYLKQID